MNNEKRFKTFRLSSVEHPSHYTSGGIERMTHEEMKQILHLSGGAGNDD